MGAQKNCLINTFLLEPTTDVKVNELRLGICIRNVKFQHVIDHNYFFSEHKKGYITFAGKSDIPNVKQH